MPEKTAPPARVRRTAKEQAARVAKTNGHAKPEKVAVECGCGCGDSTYARFKPGHDAVLKSRLVKMALAGKAPERKAAEKRLRELNWTAFLEKARGVVERKAQEAEARAAKKAARVQPKPKAPRAEAKPKSKARAAKASQKGAPAEVAPAPVAEVDEDGAVQGQAFDTDEFDQYDAANVGGEDEDM